MDLNNTIDFEREKRQGFPEIVFGEAKEVRQVAEIIEEFRKRQKSCLVTRLQREKAEELLKVYHHSHYNEVARTLRVGGKSAVKFSSHVAIISAGSSDAPVVEEACEVLSYLGVAAKVYGDKGVAGIHRLFQVLEEVKEAAVVICVAGFEGAIASVVAGLVDRPVIGVPTSVGYGVAEGGKVALNAMLASCANGLTVVNIDNGYGAALSAYRIINGLKGING